MTSRGQRALDDPGTELLALRLMVLPSFADTIEVFNRALARPPVCWMPSKPTR